MSKGKPNVKNRRFQKMNMFWGIIQTRNGFDFENYSNAINGKYTYIVKLILITTR